MARKYSCDSCNQLRAQLKTLEAQVDSMAQPLLICRSSLLALARTRRSCQFYTERFRRVGHVSPAEACFEKLPGISRILENWRS